MDKDKIIETVKSIKKFCDDHEERCSKCPIEKLCDREFITIPMDWNID